jgi:hypothetical protein
MDGFLGLPMRMKETADLFRGKGVDGERVRNRPGIERLLLGHCGNITRHDYLLYFKRKTKPEKAIQMKIRFYLAEKKYSCLFRWMVLSNQ